MHLKRTDTIILICIYSVVFVDILLSGIKIDLLAVIIGAALYFFSAREKHMRHIFFISAISSLIFAVILYSINSQYLPYNSAANWAYFFFLFGVLKMLFELMFPRANN